MRAALVWLMYGVQVAQQLAADDVISCFISADDS